MPNLPAQPARLKTIATALTRDWKDMLSSARTTIEHAARMGDRLNEAKNLVERGGWMTWVQENFPGSYETAAVYMRISENWEELKPKLQNSTTPLSIDAAVKMLSSPRKPRPEPQPAPPPVTCPNCGSHSVDDDGDCSACREPAANMRTVTEDGEPVEDEPTDDELHGEREDDAPQSDREERTPPDGLCTRVLAVCEQWQDEHPETTGHAVAVILRSVADQIEDV